MEINKHGSTVERFDGIGGDRYVFDFGPCSYKKGWQQYDTKQDAFYFGVWVHLEQRKIVTYAEGDLTITTSPNDDTLRAELKEMEAFYGPPPPSVVTFSYESDGSVLQTNYYDERPSL